MARLLLLLLGLFAGPSLADSGLPVFDGTGGYRVLGPFEGEILVQDRRGASFLCEADRANIVLLTNCRPVLTPEEVESLAAARAEAERRTAIIEERNRLLGLPEAIFEQAGRRTLSEQGCQVDLSRVAVLRNTVLPAFATALKVPDSLQGHMTRLLDDLFTQTLERLLRKREITFDRATRVAKLVECDQ